MTEPKLAIGKRTPSRWANGTASGSDRSVEEPRRGDVHELACVWRRLDLCTSSKRKGQFVALDAKTGTVRWATEGREGEHASLLLTPRHVVFLTNGADLIVIKRNAPAFAVEQTPPV